jgi:hypothetical protein
VPNIGRKKYENKYCPVGATPMRLNNWTFTFSSKENCNQENELYLLRPLNQLSE